MLVGDGIRTPKLFLKRGREHDLLGEIPKFHEVRVSRETDRERNRISWSRWVQLKVSEMWILGESLNG